MVSLLFVLNVSKHFVAKLVKSFGRYGDAAESLDDFRYPKGLELQATKTSKNGGQRIANH